MRNLAGIAAAEVVARFPLPSAARDMLDIGGSHGFFSVSLCRKHANLRSVILDLPDAVKQAASILAEEKMGDRVAHWAGNALTDELGQECVDVVLMSQLAHHFTDEQNRTLMGKIARALRPGGVCVILESIRPKKPGDGGQTAALLDLYFPMSSESGTWPIEIIQNLAHVRTAATNETDLATNHARCCARCRTKTPLTAVTPDRTNNRSHSESTIAPSAALCPAQCSS